MHLQDMDVTPTPTHEMVKESQKTKQWMFNIDALISVALAELIA